jgi:diguanylate cyclase (GGDEF)-like protein/PAS domain S-box-containing protein
VGRLSLLFRISGGLVAATLSVLLALDLLGLLPTAPRVELTRREQIAELLATEIASVSSLRELGPIRNLFVAKVRRQDGVLSVGLRGTDGRLLLNVGDHGKIWQPEQPEGSTASHVRVPIHRNGARWATLEIRFEDFEQGLGFLSFWRDPRVRLLLGFGALIFVVYVLYLRRTLRHLDPSAVIPARVQAALDVMSEGVFIVDAGGEIVLANAAFRVQTGVASSLLGVSPSQLEWRRKDAEERPTEFPWEASIAGGENVTGVALRLVGAEGQLSTLVVNSSPVLDGWGRPKGAIVTLDDVTQLERRGEELEAALVDLEKSRDEIRLQNEELQVLATTDPLSGLLNRRSFFADLEPRFARARASGQPLSFVMVDIDHFKRINDGHGHAMGDEVIVRLAQLLTLMLGPRATACRYGGEEFCVRLEETGAEEARKLAESLRCKIAAPGFARVPVTVSFGIAALGPGSESGAALVNQADEALYRAKETGRNRVVVAAGDGPA